MSDSAMTPEQAAALRAEFPAEHVGKLPKISCGACSKAQGRCCDKHQKQKCRECDNWITSAHVHLDYVGHGAVSHRLLEVDPMWSWEPLAFDPAGMPTFIYDDRNNPVAFWIKLTVCGVTRLGVGTCPSGQADAEKVLIGDALRNAAMRFGVALDLWIKGHAEDDERRSATSTAPDRRRSQSAAAPRQSGPPVAETAKPAADRAKVARITGALDQLDPGTIAELQAFVAGRGMPEHPRFLNDEQADEVIAWLTERLATEVAS